MNRKKIEQEIEKMCQDNISYKGLPMPYRTGLKMFKADVVNFILSSPLLAVRLPNDKHVEFGIRTFRNVQMASKVELILKPEHMNTVFTWKQVQDAIMDDGNDR